ncbi:MAG: Gfo/Idh/MocA family protein [Planctomycetota bacterium]
MHEINAAVVGAGFIGPVHVEALRRNGVNVTGILGVDEEESREAAQALGLPRAYLSLEEVLDDEGVDSVHLAVPNKLHYEFAKKAVQAGKHVLCEKPLAMNSGESAELVELAADRELACGVNYNMRFYPLVLEARQMVERGDVGEIYSVCGSYVQDWLLYPTDYNWRVLAEEGGKLRAVADIGTHWMDLVHSITGLEVEAVCADLKTVHPVRRRPTGEVDTFSGKKAEEVPTEEIGITTDDYGSIMFHYRNGARGTLWVSQTTAGRKNCCRYELAGANVALSWNSEQPNELWIGHRDDPNGSLLRDPALLSDPVARHADFPGGHNEGFPDTFKQSFRAFYTYIQEGDFSAPEPFASFQDGHRELVLCEAILRSHERRAWVEL